MERSTPIAQLAENLRSNLKRGIRGFKNNARDAMEPRDRKVPPTSVPGFGSLCKHCKELVQKQIIAPAAYSDTKNSVKPIIRANNGTFRHLDCLGALRASAQAGCHLCTLLDFADPHYPKSYDNTTKKPYDLVIISGVINASGVLTIRAEGYTSGGVALVRGAFKNAIGRTLRHSTTDASEILQLAKGWLRTCLETHQSCRVCFQPPREKPYSPTRLINIKATGGRLRSISLVIVREIDSLNDYLTLSHCWGSSDIIRLTESSLEAFQRGIPLSDLPKTFLDAFQIALSLGYKYIWIDSLCIIQDCKEDWEREAKTMGDVYQNSVCTIAAVGSSDSHGGCFVKRSAIGLLNCPLSDKAHTAISAKHEHPKVLPAPLLSRAWVVQERLLSVRTLYFGRDLVSFECIEARASERDPAMYTPQVTTPGFIAKSDLYELLSTSLDEEHRKSTHAHRRYKWWSLISAYTKCQMTFKTDKWAAFQGLAVQVSRAWDQKLFYGLWEEDFVEELLWNVSGRQMKRLGIQAASWSWLSVGSEVFNVQRNHFSDSRVCAEVIKPVVSLPSSPLQLQRFNETRSPAIIINACFLRLTSEAFPSKPDDWYNCKLHNGHDDLDFSSRKTWKGRWNPDTVFNKAWETYAIHMISYTPQFQVGLVVTPVNRQNQVWRRVGFYEIVWDKVPEWAYNTPRSVEEGSCRAWHKTSITLI